MPRFMVMVRATGESEAGGLPDEKLLAAMGKYNEELLKSGIMLAGEGLTPSSDGKRVAFGEDGAARVIDGPFAEAKELVGGFWIWQVSSMDEAVEWLKRAPFKGASVELRRVVEPADFEGKISRDLIDAEQRLRDQTGQQG